MSWFSQYRYSIEFICCTK